MTRNTKLYKTSFTKKGEKIQVHFRDLTVLELSFFDNIKNDAVRLDMIARTSIQNMSPDDVPWPTRLNIGEQAYNQSVKEIQDLKLLEICVSEFRDDVSKDYVLKAIAHIVEAFPGQSVTDLLKLTAKDLIELMCLSEKILNKQFFDFGNTPKKKGMSLVNSSEFEDDGKSLQEKMDQLNGFLK